MQEQDDSGLQKQYNHYKNVFEIIKNEEQFKTFKNHKLKKVRYDIQGKKQIECFLYLYDVKPDKYMYLDIIRGEAQDDKKEGLVADLFKNDVLLFAGYINDADLIKYYTQKLQGVDY